MQNDINIQDEKLELIRLITETSSVDVLQKVRKILNQAHYGGSVEMDWVMSDEQFAELKEATRLRREGKMETFTWEEVKESIRSKKRK